MNYYNENDPKAAQWLRNLVSAGLIPPGDVDDRSIADVRPSDLASYTQCHFFAGIGGWSEALRLAGIPATTRLWTGSCPCQPFSAAGQRKGTADERHLWPVFRDLIAQCRPPAVFGEQVASSDGRAWLSTVRAEMEALGYAVGAADLCAAGIGAPHPRQRLYFVGLADTDSQRRNGINPLLRENAFGRHQGETAETSRSGEDDRLADTDSQLHHRRWDAGQGGRHEYPDGSADGGLADARGNGRKQGGSGAALLALPAEQAPAQSERREQAVSSERGSRLLGLADADDAGSQGRERVPQRAGERVAGEGSVGGRVADPKSIRKRADKSGSDCGDRILLAGAEPGGDSINDGTDDSMADPKRPSPPDSFWSSADWLYCRDGKWRPIEPAAQQMVDGLSCAVGFLRADKTLKEELTNASKTSDIAGQVLRSLRENHAPTEIWWSIGRRIGLPQTTLLLAALCEQSRELGDILHGKAQGGSQDIEEPLPKVLDSASADACPPHGRRCAEQLTWELGDALSELPQTCPSARPYLPLLAEFTGSPLAEKVPGRVGRLRGYGNAIVPQVAATFIRAALMP